MSYEGGVFFLGAGPFATIYHLHHSHKLYMGGGTLYQGVLYRGVFFKRGGILCNRVLHIFSIINILIGI